MFGIRWFRSGTDRNLFCYFCSFVFACPSRVFAFLVSGVCRLQQYKTFSISKAKLSKTEKAYFKQLYFRGLLFGHGTF